MLKDYSGKGATHNLWQLYYFVNFLNIYSLNQVSEIFSILGGLKPVSVTLLCYLFVEIFDTYLDSQYDNHFQLFFCDS